MKHLPPQTFEDIEYNKLLQAKEQSGLSWHDFILTLVKQC